MISFEQFKKKPLLEGKIEKKAPNEPSPDTRKYDEEKQIDTTVQGRNERRLEALEKEILEVRNYMAEKIPGSHELEGIQERAMLMAPEERRVVLRDFDKRFPGSRREYINAERDIQKRTEAIQKIKRRISGKYSFEKAA